MRSRRRRRGRHFPVMETIPLNVTPEELLADLDPGWAVWEPRDRSSENPDGTA